MTNEFKPKSFWERPEGTTGMFAIGLGAVAAYFSLDFMIALLDKVITLLGKGIALGVLGLIAFGLVMIVTNKKFQTLVSYGFKSLMRMITGAFVEIDPIGIMKSYIDDLKAKRLTMEESIAKLRGQVTVCRNQVQQNEADHEREMSKVKVARDQGKNSALTVAARQAGRLEKLNNESLKPLLFQMEVHLKALMKYHEVTGTVIDDLHNEVKAQEVRRKMITESHSAMTTAKKILSGGTDEKELFDQAMEYVVNDYGMKMGEIENFIENSKGFVEGLDLQNGVYEEAALAKLQKWEADADSILMGNGKRQMLEQSTVNSPITHGIGQPAAFDFSELMKKDK